MVDTVLPNSGVYQKISVIVPTIGRPESLTNLLQSLSDQTIKVDEVIVADGSSTDETEAVVFNRHWQTTGLVVHHLRVGPPNAVRQRKAAIAASRGEYLLLLDDDVVLEPRCVEHMMALVTSNVNVVGVTADFNNETWSRPTRFWSLYLRHVLRLSPGAWQGRVVGPLLHFGYNPAPESPQPMEWLATCNSLVRRSAYDRVGGFSDFFLRRSTMNEDVDLGLKLSRIGQILFCPAARLAHHHALSGRVSVADAAEDDLFNRFMILNRTLLNTKSKSFILVLSYFVIESLSNLLGSIRRTRTATTFDLLKGRLRGLIQIGRICFGTRRQDVLTSLR